jgi:hypothetical protein
VLCGRLAVDDGENPPTPAVAPINRTLHARKYITFFDRSTLSPLPAEPH